MGTASMGHQAALAVDDSAVTQISDFDANSFRYEFKSESLALAGTHTHNDGIRGTRSKYSDQDVITARTISGDIVMNPRTIDMVTWFPRILGAAPSGTTFALAETLPVFGVLVDRIAERFVYTGCYVNRARIRGTSGGLIEVTVSVEGKDEVNVGTAFPGTVPASSITEFFHFGQCTFALAADVSAAEVKEFEITIDNMLDTSRFMNAITRAQIPSMGRNITLRVVTPYTADEIALHNQAIAGAAGTLTLTGAGAVSTLFTFGNLKAPAKSPVTQNKGEILLDLTMNARFVSGGARELVVTHDSTP